jgi:hypothetical protein
MVNQVQVVAILMIANGVIVDPPFGSVQAT